MFAATPAQAQTEETVWSATLTLRDLQPDFPGWSIGCAGAAQSAPAAAYCSSTLTDNSFSYGGYTFRIDRLDYTDQSVIGSAGVQLDLQLDKAIPASIENSLKLVVGNRKQEFKLAGAPTGNRVTARWTEASIEGWRETARVPVSLVRANPPRFLGANKKDQKLELRWQLPTRAQNDNGIDVDVHLTTSTTVGDYAAASGSDMAAGWVKHSVSTSLPARRDVTGLVNGRKYRFRVRIGDYGDNNVIAYGAWAFGSGTPSARTPVTVRTNDATCLTGLEIKGVRANGTKTEALPLLGTVAGSVGLGPPGILYAIRVPADVKKVEVKPEWTISTLLSMGAGTSSLTGGPSRGWILGDPWGSSDSGTAKEVLLTPGSGVTKIQFTIAVTAGCGHTSTGVAYYDIYAYHDNFATTANDRLRTLQMNAGN